ncbi:MAG: RHS repeat-associated core domain-containing protein, partial [Abditibacteriales bacterium]|nr:RHS repeat-associated core domain-containing protein [Abditibacteriales bacterium]
TQGSNVVAHYVYGVNRVSRDVNGSSYEYYHSDGLGSTRQLTSDTQSITQTTTFDAFGNIESNAGSSNNAYKYAGQWGYRNDGDDGLMHVGARYYDPLVGRFISADTWLGDITRPQSLNPYVYCEGDSVNHVDPTGFDKQKTIWGIVADLIDSPFTLPGLIRRVAEWIVNKFEKKPPEPPVPPSGGNGGNGGSGGNGGKGKLGGIVPQSVYMKAQQDPHDLAELIKDLGGWEEAGLRPPPQFRR